MSSIRAHKEKIDLKMHGQKSKQLSPGSKEITMNYVIYAISTFFFFFNYMGPFLVFLENGVTKYQV